MTDAIKMAFEAAKKDTRKSIMKQIVRDGSNK